jgi:hypothetical protein
MEREALKALVQEMEYVLACINLDTIPFDGDCFHEALRLGKEALAQPAQERQWIWLSDADIADVIDTTCQYTGSYEEYLIKKAERKIRGMNT